MEKKILLKQKFTTCEIQKARNYSRLSDKIRIVNKIDKYRNKPEFHHIKTSVVQRNKNAKFKYIGYYGGSEFFEPLINSIDAFNDYLKQRYKGLNISDYEQNYITLDCYKPIYTKDDRKIKKYYNDPFANIKITIFERKIIQHINKLTIKIYVYIKERKINEIYFRKKTYQYVISFDLEKFNFTLVKNTPITIKGKIKNNISIQKNRFKNLYNLLSYIFFPEKHLSNIINFKELNNEYYTNLYTCEFINKFMKELIGYEIIPTIFNKKEVKENWFEINLFTLEKITEKFVEKKQIKISNKFKYLLYHFYPTEKFLKKNNRKLISSVLDSFDLKTKSTIKLLHENPEINLYDFIELCKLFGKTYYKYIGKINTNVFTKTNFYNQSPFALGLENKGQLNNRKEIINNVSKNLIQEKDKSKIVKFLNDAQTHQYIDSRLCPLISRILDHFLMIEKVRKAGLNFKFNGYNQKEFGHEHTRLSNLIMLINKGWIREYIYNKETLKSIEKPIIVLSNNYETIKFQPRVLVNQNEYNEEGSSMHHCVASYIDYPSSMIVSIRKISSDNEIIDKVTCEIDIRTGRLQQARYILNKKPPEIFNEPIKYLEERTIQLRLQDKLSWIETKKTKIRINGITINSDYEDNEIDQFQQVQGIETLENLNIF